MLQEQELERNFMGGIVRQRHLSGLFCINDFIKIGNVYRKNQGLTEVRWDKYLDNVSTKDFIKRVMQEENDVKVIHATRGRKGNTWVHPLIFLDFVMWISPDFKIQVYKWLYDNLLVFRDASGDSYKLMAKTYKHNNPDLNPAVLGKDISFIAKRIKTFLQVEDWNKASEEQLKKRDIIHNKIITLLEADVSIDKIIEVAIK